MKALRQKILATLAYADVFDYPLTAGEIQRFLISKNPVSKATVATFFAGDLWKKDLGKAGPYFFLPGRRRIVSQRQQREGYARIKLKKARQYAFWLRFLPTVKMVALTGALAMKNTGKDDDIDFLIVSRQGWVWTTRFLTTLLFDLLKLRRQPKEKNYRDKACFNMFVGEDCLPVPQKERDLFSAHEVVQLQPLWDRGEVAARFRQENHWVNRYLANSGFDKGRSFIKSRPDKPISVLERGLRRLQLGYMRRRLTSEVVSENYIRFHPQDARKWVLPAYRRRVSGII